jgi:phage repressor protein C with HTH and peptisase S24 domain
MRVIRSANPLVAFLDQAADARGWTREGLSKRAGLSKDAIRSIENRGPRATGNMLTLQKLAAALDIDVTTLIAASPNQAVPLKPPASQTMGELRLANYSLPIGLPRDVPVRGTVAGSALGSFKLMSGLIGFVRRPPGLVGMTDIYSLYVENESMYPKYSSGELIFVHPYRPLAVGDAMVIQIKNDPTADTEGYIKIYKGRTADYVIGEQFNPSAKINYRRETIVMAHRVFPTNELFGL